MPTARVLRITAPFVSILFTSSSTRTLISAGFPSCRGLVFAVPTIPRPVTSGKPCSHRTQTRWCLIFCCRIRHWRSQSSTASDTFRPVFNTGVEASFKLSQTWENVQSRALGLDGLLHVIQPFTDFSYVDNFGASPASILQFDRFEPSTQLRPIDFPQFTSIDSIDSWTVWRLGVRNRLETRRDDSTTTWLELDTFFDVNFDNPFDRTPYSNFFNNIRFTPLPWATLYVSTPGASFRQGFYGSGYDPECPTNREFAIDRWASLFEWQSLLRQQQLVCRRRILPLR